MDKQYHFIKPTNPFELDHNYDDDVHVIYDPLVLSALSRLGKESADGILRLHDDRAIVRAIYRTLMSHVMRHEFTPQDVETKTPMAKYIGDQGFYRGPAFVGLDAKTMFAGISRGRTIPSEELQEYLSLMTGFAPKLEDIMAERQSTNGQVTGVKLAGSKCDVDPDGHVDTVGIVQFADQMAASGTTIKTGSDLYTNFLPNDEGIVFSRPTGLIGIHLVVAPEYLHAVKTHVAARRAERPDYPGIKIYTARVDRSLSDQNVLETKLGTYPAAPYPSDKTPPNTERALTKNGYIGCGLGDRGKEDRRTKYR